MAAAEPSTQRAGLVSGQPLTARPTWSDQLPRAWFFPLAVFAATWLLILAAWFGSDAIAGRSHRWTWHFLFKDANFYLSIAAHGYTGDPYKAAFFPVFPLLVRITGYLTGGDYAVAGLIVTVACGAASAVAVWLLAVRVCDRWVADRAVMLYCVFPGAMAFGMLYSEPLSVAIGAAALLALLDRRWLLAGIIGAVGTAERPTLIVLAVVSGVAALQAIWTRREWQALLAPALTPLGILAYFGYLGQRHHDYGYWFRLEKSGWNQQFDWGRHTVSVLLWLNPRDANHRVFVVVLTVMFAAAVAGIALMIAARLPLPVTLFGILTILLTVTSSAGDTRPRFVWAAFPLFIGAAAKLPRAVYWPVLVLSAAGLVFLLGGWPYHLIGRWTAP